MRDSDVAANTTAGYLAALERLMVLEPLPAWSPVLRSRARIRTASKHHFVDPAMSASLLNAGPDELRRDLKTFGFLFESLAIRDLRVYADASAASVCHYRDSNGLEVDAVVDGGFQRWGACEMKLASSAEVIDRAAEQLQHFADTVDTQVTGAPRFLAVITASGYAYTRPDGVLVIPLATLSA
jgi:predicted AAA+ superfamily ATPase